MTDTHTVLCLAIGSPSIDSAYLSITEPGGATIKYELGLTQLELIGIDAFNKAQAWRNSLLPPPGK